MLDDVAAADLRQRSAARRIGSHAHALLVGNGGFKVTLQFLVELAFNALLLEERFQAGSKVSQPIHGVLLRAFDRWLVLRFKNARDGGDLTLPLFRFAGESLSPLRSEQVILRATIVLRRAPLGLHAPAALHPAKSWKQGSRVDAEDAGADLLNAQGYAVAVHGFESQGLEDQHLKCPLDHVTRSGLCYVVHLTGHRSLLLTIKMRHCFLLIVKRRSWLGDGPIACARNDTDMEMFFSRRILETSALAAPS